MNNTKTIYASNRSGQYFNTDFKPDLVSKTQFTNTTMLKEFVESQIKCLIPYPHETREVYENIAIHAHNAALSRVIEWIEFSTPSLV